MKQTNRKGFTLAELLIVVAIIAVLVAIAIPVFTKQLHNAKASADMANIRAYYAELQLNYQETGEYNTSVPDVHGNLTNYDPSYITMLNGNKIDLQVGLIQSLLSKTKDIIFGMYAITIQIIQLMI